MKLTILGACRTKKNSLRRMKFGNRVLSVGSEAAMKWETAAIWQVKSKWRHPAITGPVWVRATFYRDRNVGDLVGYMQSLGDILEKAGVIENDRLITSWDQTRLDKDAARPRVELEIFEMAMEASK